jgi:uncharacterized protein (TIGR01319 family)
MVCIGLVPENTTEAGRLAALGAGANIVGTNSYDLSQGETEEIAATKPDIILLTGGTDGGNKKSSATTPACSRNTRAESPTSSWREQVRRDEVRAIFAAAGREVIFSKNVMPEFGRLDIDPVNEKIREIFIRISRRQGHFESEGTIGDVIMPTPSAVLERRGLWRTGARGHTAWGNCCCRRGRSTTDVYSIARGTPTKDGVKCEGLTRAVREAQRRGRPRHVPQSRHAGRDCAAGSAAGRAGAEFNGR